MTVRELRKMLFDIEEQDKEITLEELKEMMGAHDHHYKNVIEKMRADGYPYKIKGNDGYEAVLCDIQPLFGGDYMAVYRYPGGKCCHDLNEIAWHFEIIEQ